MVSLRTDQNDKAEMCDDTDNSRYLRNFHKTNQQKNPSCKELYNLDLSDGMNSIANQECTQPSIDSLKGSETHYKCKQKLLILCREYFNQFTEEITLKNFCRPRNNCIDWENKILASWLLKRNHLIVIKLVLFAILFLSLIFDFIYSFEKQTLLFWILDVNTWSLILSTVYIGISEHLYTVHESSDVFENKNPKSNSSSSVIMSDTKLQILSKITNIERKISEDRFTQKSDQSDNHSSLMTPKPFNNTLNLKKYKSSFNMNLETENSKDMKIENHLLSSDCMDCDHESNIKFYTFPEHFLAPEINQNFDNNKLIDFSQLNKYTPYKIIKLKKNKKKTKINQIDIFSFHEGSTLAKFKKFIYVYRDNLNFRQNLTCGYPKLGRKNAFKINKDIEKKSGRYSKKNIILRCAGIKNYECDFLEFPISQKYKFFQFEPSNNRYQKRFIFILKSDSTLKSTFTETTLPYFCFSSNGLEYYRNYENQNLSIQIEERLIHQIDRKKSFPSVCNEIQEDKCNINGKNKRLFSQTEYHGKVKASDGLSFCNSHDTGDSSDTLISHNDGFGISDSISSDNNSCIKSGKCCCFNFICMNKHLCCPKSDSKYFFQCCRFFEYTEIHPSIYLFWFFQMLCLSTTSIYSFFFYTNLYPCTNIKSILNVSIIPTIFIMISKSLGPFIIVFADVFSGLSPYYFMQNLIFSYFALGFYLFVLVLASTDKAFQCPDQIVELDRFKVFETYICSYSLLNRKSEGIYLLILTIFLVPLICLILWIFCKDNIHYPKSIKNNFTHEFRQDSNVICTKTFIDNCDFKDDIMGIPGDDGLTDYSRSISKKDETRKKVRKPHSFILLTDDSAKSFVGKKKNCKKAHEDLKSRSNLCSEKCKTEKKDLNEIIEREMKTSMNEIQEFVDPFPEPFPCKSQF